MAGVLHPARQHIEGSCAPRAKLDSRVRVNQRNWREESCALWAGFSESLTRRIRSAEISLRTGELSSGTSNRLTQLRASPCSLPAQLPEPLASCLFDLSRSVDHHQARPIPPSACGTNHPAS